MNWATNYGLLGTEERDSLALTPGPRLPLTSYADRGRQESLDNFRVEVFIAEKCLALYEAAMRPLGGPDEKVLRELLTLHWSKRQ